MEKKYILLTGTPGIGKTTLIKKLIDRLKHKKIDGFYTEELRNQSRQRIGFDIISLLDGKKEKLARLTNSLQPFEITNFKVGQYTVFPTQFEKIALPVFKTNQEIYVLDEIGKMELFSGSFQSEVTKLFQKDCFVLATIPLPKGPNKFLDSLRNHPRSKLFELNLQNRNSLEHEILKLFNI